MNGRDSDTDPGPAVEPSDDSNPISKDDASDTIW